MNFSSALKQLEDIHSNEINSLEFKLKQSNNELQNALSQNEQLKIENQQLRNAFERAKKLLEAYSERLKSNSQNETTTISPLSSAKRKEMENNDEDSKNFYSQVNTTTKKETIENNDPLDLDILEKQTTQENNPSTQQKRAIPVPPPIMDLTSSTKVDLTQSEKTKQTTKPSELSKHEKQTMNNVNNLNNKSNGTSKKQNPKNEIVIISDSQSLTQSSNNNNNKANDNDDKANFNNTNTSSNNDSKKRKRTSSTGTNNNTNSTPTPTPTPTTTTNKNQEIVRLEDDEWLQQYLILKKPNTAPKIPISLLKQQEEKQKQKQQNKTNFAHVAIVRNKAERAQLPAHECAECQKFYDAIKDTVNISKSDLMNRCSRHRSLYAAPDTPPDFWNLGFPDSEPPTTTSDRNNEDEDEGGDHQQQQTIDTTI